MTIFLGSLYPSTMLEELIRRGEYADYPANVFQSSLLKGLFEINPDLRIVTSPVIKSPYFKVRDLCKQKYFSFEGRENSVGEYIGSLPISGIYMIYELWKARQSLKRIISSSSNTNVLIYALHSPFLLAVWTLKRKINCVCVVIPDLPEFMTNESGFFRRFLKKIDKKIIDFCLKRFEGYALLSPFMRDRLPIKDKPWVLVEGIYDTSLAISNHEKSYNKVILYTGSLDKRYGISELLKAFNSISTENYRLWICGDGDGKEDVLNMSKKDNRITYWGVLKHNEIIKLQQQATVLVNPRNSKGNFTKYSFPSKTMEYLASGTPTIMCHLPAIPPEYDSYLYYITDETADGIKCKLCEVCEKPQSELDAFGQRAAEFIKSQKNSYVQAKKIADLINEISQYSC